MKQFSQLTGAIAFALISSVTPVPAGAQTAPSIEGYAPVEGGEVYYNVIGSGEPLVMLHGGLGTIELFGPAREALAKDHMVIGIDLDAHGRTLPLDRPASYEAMGEDVIAVLDTLGIEQADLLGFSMGGGVALRTVIQHPARVDRVVLVSTPYAFAGWHETNQQGMSLMGAHIAEQMKQSPVYELYAAVAPDLENWPALLDTVGELSRDNDYDWSNEIRQIENPVMLIAGDWDAVRTSHLASFFELLGGGAQDAGWDGSNMNANRLAILPGKTHYTILTSDDVADAVTPFLNAE